MWAKKKINFIKQSNITKNTLKGTNNKTIVNLLNSSEFTKATCKVKMVSTNTIKKKSICVGTGKYNNNLGLLKTSRHYLKFLLTKNQIFIPKKKW